jgi:phosphohistidine phosphatase SixA
VWIFSRRPPRLPRRARRAAPLTDEGRATRARSARSSPPIIPDAVVCSPLLRARQTAEAIARAAGLEVHPDDRLAPGADVSNLSNAVGGQGETVVVVGHQPDCTEIVLALTGEKRPFEPGGYAELDL